MVKKSGEICGSGNSP